MTRNVGLIIIVDFIIVASALTLACDLRPKGCCLRHQWPDQGDHLDVS